ncbi:MAG: RDD family protein [Planctomycetia bacterium]|nr:RDD family protein [Planctomycetia bacterium]
MSTGESCPLCGKSKGMNRKSLLYGYNVCKRCRNGFANRRQIAYFIDGIVAFVLQILAGVVLGILLGITGLTSETSVGIVDWFLFAFFFVALLAKDGFSGMSPGKALMGVRAVDRTTGVPIGFGASIVRNLPTAIPVVPLIVGLQLINGPRWGDRWAGTKVIWRKYADSPIFTGVPRERKPAFAPVAANLAPVRETGNPYQAPRQ